MFYVILYESFVFIKENLKKKYLVSSSNKNSFYYFFVWKNILKFI